jgi:lipopolysaccharide transport system ATP-binding protein
MDITAADHKAEVVWNSVESAPGDTNVRVVGVRVLNKYLQVSENLPIDEEFYLEIDLFNCKDGNYLTSNFQLFHRNGVGVLSTGNWASATSNIDAYAGAAYKKGFYKSRVLMPANFLNEGTYFVNALVLQDASIIRVFVDEAVSFNIVDTGEMRKEYTDEWLGVVRPKLEWHTNPM